MVLRCRSLKRPQLPQMEVIGNVKNKEVTQEPRGAGQVETKK